MKKLLLFLVVANLLPGAAARVQAGGNSLNALDNDAHVYSTDLVLDSQGYPVISYSGYYPDTTLRLVHCNDPNCANGDDSNRTPDLENVNGGYSTSLALDNAGFPVISHISGSGWRIVHCNDPNCANQDDISTTPDPNVSRGWNASLALDSSGNPVSAYFERYYVDTGQLWLLHCRIPFCDGVHPTDVALTGFSAGAAPPWQPLPYLLALNLLGLVALGARLAWRRRTGR